MPAKNTPPHISAESERRNDVQADAGGSLGKILITSRSLDEYRAMFALTDEDLSRRILDCPSGAAGFTAQVRARGGDATACDIAYLDGGLGAVAVNAADEVERGNQYVRTNPDLYSTKYFANADEHRQQRLQSARAFTDHIANEPERYVPGQLPELPFAERQFDLVLSSHLLFSYPNDFDYNFHRQALIELMRVTENELRVFPLVAVGEVTPYPALDALRDDLADAGIRSSVVDVNYEFQVGANQMLVCRHTNEPSSH